MILDANGHQVPDRTPVDFTITQQGEGSPSQVISATTENGVASIQLALEHTGLLEIIAQSGSARLSETLQLNVQLGVAAQATVISPTRVPTATSQPTRTPLVPSPTPESNGSTGQAPPPIVSMGWNDLVLGFMGIALVGGAGYFVSNLNGLRKGMQVRCVLVTVIGALAGYNYLALQLPGSATLIETIGAFAGLLLAVIGGVVGLALAQTWCRRPKFK